MYAMEKNLRGTIHAEVDAIFEEESLLGTKWDRDGDRHQWEYLDNGDRTLKLVPSADVERYGEFGSSDEANKAYAAI